MSGKDNCLEQLPIDDVRVHPKFQLRANGTDPAHVKKLEAVLRDGQELPPIRVARIGKALYLIGGHHRLEAHRRLRRVTVRAEVTRMSLPEAQAAALLENTDHGKAMSRADKQAQWSRYVEEGHHLDASGCAKGSTTIERELGYMYSRPTIRKRLKGLGVPIDLEEEYPHGYKPWRASDDDELAQDRLWNALEGLEHFRFEYLTLDSRRQRELRETARNLLEAMDREETPPPIATGPLDI